MSSIITDSPGDQTRRALARGTRMQEFEILGLIGQGGFGIVYLAHDHSLQRRVALKEYMPPLAIRHEGTTEVCVSSARDSEAFEKGRESFVTEARLLARFDHPALVKVHRFWEGNSTAYMAMPFYEGPTLQRAVAEKRLRTDEDYLRQMLNPLLEALGALHRERCYHRDISPDNILITGTGPVLLDFGAARQAFGDVSQSFTVILKEGYAPVEQYATEDIVAARQGPWTDIYALCGVVRYAITGKKPPSAVARMVTATDPLTPLALTYNERYSAAFLSALDAGMSVYPEQRPQSIEQLRTLLSHLPATLEDQTLERPLPTRKPAPAAAQPESPRRRGRVLPWVVPLVLAAASGAYLGLGKRPGTAPAAVSASASAPSASSASVRLVEESKSTEPDVTSSSASPPQVAAVQSTSSALADEAASAPSTPVEVPPHRPEGGRVPGRERLPPLPPALIPMLKAAQFNMWGMVERQAMLLARSAPPVAEGNRQLSRRNNELGLAALRTQHYPQAVSAFREGFMADASDIEVANNYGYALALADRRPDAQMVLTDVLLREPTRSVAWTALAEVRSDNETIARSALKIALHFATSRERTLNSFREMARSHRDVRVQRIVSGVLEQRNRIPTLPESPLERRP